jgi:hypothetical protein
MDSLRIDVLGRGGKSPFINLERILRRLLERLRVATRQWWILRSSDALLRYDRSGFDIDWNGAPIGSNPQGITHARIPFGFESGINNEIWMACIEAAVRGVETPMYEMSLLDAFYFVAASDLRSAVMQASSALEQAIESCCSLIWERNNLGKFRRGCLTGRNVTVHLSRDLDRYLGRSFEHEFPHSFVLLRRLWRARGDVAHGRPLQSSAASHSPDLIEDLECEQMVRAVRTALKWLQTL